MTDDRATLYSSLRADAPALLLMAGASFCLLVSEVTLLRILSFYLFPEVASCASTVRKGTAAGYVFGRSEPAFRARCSSAWQPMFRWTCLT